MSDEEKEEEEENTNEQSKILEAVKQVYDIDVAAIRNLSQLAGEINNNDGKIKLPGNVEITGTLSVKGTANVDGTVTSSGNNNGFILNGSRTSEIANVDGAFYRSNGNAKIVVDDNLELYHLKNNKPELGWQYVKGNIYHKTGNLYLQNGKNATVEGKLWVTGGSDFSGGKHYFTDSEKCGRLRVGCAWGLPGLYSEDSKSLVLGAKNGHVDIKSQLNVKDGKHLKVDNGDIYSKNKRVVKQDDKIVLKNTVGHWLTSHNQAVDNRNNMFASHNIEFK